MLVWFTGHQLFSRGQLTVCRQHDNLMNISQTSVSLPRYSLLTNSPPRMKFSLEKFVLGAVAAFALVPPAQAQTTTYAGNGGTSFGGQLGGSSLAVSENTSTGLLTFTFTPGGSGFYNNIAFYIDSGTGGVTSSTQINDTGGSGTGVTTADAGPNLDFCRQQCHRPSHGQFPNWICRELWARL